RAGDLKSGVRVDPNRVDAEADSAHRGVAVKRLLLAHGDGARLSGRKVDVLARWKSRLAVGGDELEVARRSAERSGLADPRDALAARKLARLEAAARARRERPRERDERPIDPTAELAFHHV